MKRIISRLIIICFCCINNEYLYAQTAVQGHIVDSQSLVPIPFATIILKKEVIGKTLYSSSTDDSGHFSLSVKPDAYILEITAVGFKQKNIVLQVNDKRIFSSGRIRLARDSQIMQTVEVVARKPVYRFGPGKIIYEVNQDVRALGKNAWELLRQAPLISIQGSESIQLKGKSNFLLQLNGKTQPALSSNPATFLQSMDQTQIERIEIITNPSAKYTAEGIAGIINVITKKQLKSGAFGSVNVGFDTYRNSSAGLNLYGKKGKLGYSLTSNGSLWRNGVYDYMLEQTVGNKKIIANAQTIPRRNNMNMIGSLSYVANAKNTFNFDASLYLGDGKIEQLFHEQGVKTDVVNDIFLHNVTLGLDWERKIDSLSSLVVSYKTEQQRSKSEIIYQQSGISFENKNFSEEHTFQGDYKRRALEIGAKGIRRRFVSNLIRNVQSDDDYGFLQQVFAGYVSYSHSMKIFNFEAGLRAEYVNLKGEVKGKDQFLNETFFQLFPTVSLEKSVERIRMNFSLSYSRRTARPQLYYLNPFINAANPYSFTNGNASLRPEMSNSFEFRATRNDRKGNQHIVNLSYQNSVDAISQFVFPINDTVLSGTYLNLPLQQVWGLSYYSTILLFKKIQLGLSNNLYYINYPTSALRLNNKNYNVGTEGWYGSFGLSFSGTIFKKIRWTSSNNFTLRDVYLQGWGRHFFYQDLTLVAPLFKNKLMVLGAFRQPFWRDYRFETTYSDESFSQFSQNTTPQRRLFFGFRYAFGKQTQNVSRTRKKIDNEDKKSKSSLETIK